MSVYDRWQHSFAAYENFVGIAEAVDLKEYFGVAPMAEFGTLGPDEGEGVKEKDRGRDANRHFYFQPKEKGGKK